MFNQSEIEDVIRKEQQEMRVKKAGETVQKEARQRLQDQLMDPNFLPTREFALNAFPPTEPYTPNREWTAFLEKADTIHELLTEGYITALTDYIVSSLEQMDIPEGDVINILEPGAGNGRLTHFLQMKLNKRMPDRVKVISLDGGYRGYKPDFPVEDTPIDQALKKYKPKIVVCSWMEIGQDWSQAFRDTESVGLYILIGDIHGSSGCDWETWGEPYDPFVNEDEIAKRLAGPTPYQADGFEKYDLDELRQLQMSELDNHPPTGSGGDLSKSHTVAFIKERR